MIRKAATFIIASLVISHFTACAPVVKNATSINHPGVKKAAQVKDEYRIQVGDQLEIKFFYDSELNEGVVVRPDGRISLQLIHEVTVVGLTPAELADMLTQKYAEHLKQPEIAVIVRSFDAFRVYVDGEVYEPGEHSFIGSLSVMQSISKAGGFKETARLKEVVIIRKSAKNKPLVIPVNVEQVINGTDMAQDIALLPLDIVYVPKSPIANVNQWVDQYISKTIPFSLGFGVSIEIDE